MKRLKIFIMLLALAGGCASGAAHAARVGVFVGPVYPPYYYPVAPVRYYYPPVVAVPAGPGQLRRTRAAVSRTGATRRVLVLLRRVESLLPVCEGMPSWVA
jgi:hypothetical protein